MKVVGGIQWIANKHDTLDQHFLIATVLNQFLRELTDIFWLIRTKEQNISLKPRLKEDYTTNR